MFGSTSCLTSRDPPPSSDLSDVRNVFTDFSHYDCEVDGTGNGSICQMKHKTVGNPSPQEDPVTRDVQEVNLCKTPILVP